MESFGKLPGAVRASKAQEKEPLLSVFQSMQRFGPFQVHNLSLQQDPAVSRMLFGFKFKPVTQTLRALGMEHVLMANLFLYDNS